MIDNDKIFTCEDYNFNNEQSQEGFMGDLKKILGIGAGAIVLIFTILFALMSILDKEEKDKRKIIKFIIEEHKEELENMLKSIKFPDDMQTDHISFLSKIQSYNYKNLYEKINKTFIENGFNQFKNLNESNKDIIDQFTSKISKKLNIIKSISIEDYSKYIMKSNRDIANYFVNGNVKDFKSKKKSKNLKFLTENSSPFLDYDKVLDKCENFLNYKIPNNFNNKVSGVEDSKKVENFANNILKSFSTNIKSKYFKLELISDCDRFDDLEKNVGGQPYISINIHSILLNDDCFKLTKQQIEVVKKWAEEYSKRK